MPHCVAKWTTWSRIDDIYVKSIAGPTIFFVVQMVYEEQKNYYKKDRHTAHTIVSWPNPK